MSQVRARDQVGGEVNFKKLIVAAMIALAVPAALTACTQPQGCGEYEYDDD